MVSSELRLPRESYSFDLEYPEGEGDQNIIFSGTRVTTVDNARYVADRCTVRCREISWGSPRRSHRPGLLAALDLSSVGVVVLV